MHDTASDPPVSLPRVNATCDYRDPLKYEDEVEVQLLVREKRTKSITFEFRFRKRGAEEVVALGSITVVSVTIDRATGRMTPIAIPQRIDRLIEVPRRVNSWKLKLEKEASAPDTKNADLMHK